ncbi:glycosylated lysosomal membrane protein-like [Centruroides sculpturatus]|uniref:glycosylated lysosomal membrane protein-like n=1 Tax=Centruroides sculpturatus TaxID=218467 RepID=UPI000C6CC063|nr:glycosylated lysosomal membrane protein-like [Centruroides sculpturatus]
MANLCYAWKKFLILLFTYLVFSIAKCEVKRNLSLLLNPDCDEYPECKSSKVSIFYTEAVGPNDILHYLWSTQGGIPSALIVQTNLSVQLRINWTVLLSDHPKNAISFTEKPLYSFAMLLTKLLRYDDADDTGNMTNYVCESMDFSGVNWTFSDKITNNSDLCSVTFETSENSTEFLEKGNFIFQLSAFSDDNRGERPPRLLHNSANNEVGIILNNLKINSTKSRYAVEFMAIYNSEENEPTLHKKESSNLDDEFTPGVFSTIKLLTASSNCSNLCASYLLWKPVAYTDKDSTVSLSTDVKIYNVMKTDQIPLESIISAYFENKTIQISTWNISFGMTGDKFYKDKKYTSWYLTIGLGVPPEDSPTIALILTIAIGFGTPFVCMIAGSIYMGIRKFFKKEDDLLLSRESM